MSIRPESTVFGKRRSQHVLILASGDRIRHMTVRPWMAALAVCFACVFSIGYLAATSYLVFRDDLIGGTMARQARMQHDYEDRIAALRAQVDRVTSRQLLDQQVVEEKVETLLRQQLALTSRKGKIGTLLERAEDSGLDNTGFSEPARLDPGADPGLDPASAYDGGDRKADASGGVNAIEKLLGLAGTQPESTQASPGGSLAAAYAPVAHESLADRADRMFSKVTLSLKTIEQDQLARIRALTTDAAETADKILTIIDYTGIAIPEAETGDARPSGDTSAVGGPFVQPEPAQAFDRSLDALDGALTRLDRLRRSARALPFSNPAPASDITSRFGNRVDPFLGRLALHAGIDFRAPTGTTITSTGAGTVVSAQRNGGYGNMVEIDHGQGVTTRYAHLSLILVNPGTIVEAGDAIGKVGSTGRSTGPHLHYEVRLHGGAVDPMRFIKAGQRLAKVLQ